MKGKDGARGLLLPPLPPDIRFERLDDGEAGVAFSFGVKKEALGPHVRARWPWEEDFQQGLHRRRLAEKPFFAIKLRDEPVGTVSWRVEGDHVRFGEFYLLARVQNMGLGSRILKHALAQADALRRPVRLEYLKWNPVGRLYLRHGFQPTHESETHVFAERTFC